MESKEPAGIVGVLHAQKILLVVIAAALLRAALFTYVLVDESAELKDARYAKPDSLAYNNAAVNFVRQGTFSTQPPPAAGPDTDRTPGYPFFLAAVYGLAGIYPKAAILIQCALSVGSCFLLYLLLKKYFKRKVGRLGALLLAVSPLSIALSNYLLSETLFAFVLLLALIAVQRSLDSGGAASSAFAGFFFGALALIHPSALLLAVPVLVFIFIRHSGNFRRALAHSAAFAALFAVLAGGWAYRNYRLTGEMIFCDTAGQTLLFCDAAALKAELENKSLLAVRKELSDACDETTKGMSGAARARECSRRASGIILKNPLRYAKIHVIKSFNSLLPSFNLALELTGTSTGGKKSFFVMNDKGPFAALKNYLGGRLWLALFFIPEIIYLAFIYIFAAVGFRVMFKQKKEVYLMLLLLFVALIYFFLIAGPAATPRLRMAYEPILIAFAAIGFHRERVAAVIREREKKKK